MENCDADVDCKLIRIQARYRGGQAEAGIIWPVECDEAIHRPVNDRRPQFGRSQHGLLSAKHTYTNVPSPLDTLYLSSYTNSYECSRMRTCRLCFCVDSNSSSIIILIKTTLKLNSRLTSPSFLIIAGRMACQI